MAFALENFLKKQIIFNDPIVHHSALASLMEIAGENYGLLLEDEICCGSTVKRIGQSKLFEKLREENVNIRLDSFDNAPLVRAMLLGILTPDEIAQRLEQFELLCRERGLPLTVQRRDILIVGRTLSERRRRPWKSANSGLSGPCTDSP